MGGLQKVATGIPDLDTLLDGGIPQGHTVMVSGNSGTGKTVLSMEWLFRGYEEVGEHGLYITLTESVTEAAHNVSTMSFYDESAREGGGVRFTDLRTTLDLLGIEGQITAEDIEPLIDAIGEMVEDAGAERLVIDSITAIGQFMANPELLRSFVFQLDVLLEEQGVTTLLTSEVSGEGYSAYGIEEFVSDGIIMLDYENISGHLRRSLEVVKMRGTGFQTGIHHFDITGNGIQLFSYEQGLAFPAYTSRIGTGCTTLDRMMDGGILEGTATMVAGPAGSGKTILSLGVAAEALGAGRKVLYASFEESEEQLLDAMEAFGWDGADTVASGDLGFYCVNPEMAYPEEFLSNILSRVDEEGYDLVIVDSLTAIQNIFAGDVFQEFARMSIRSLKSRGVTSLFTTSQQGVSTASEMGGKTLATMPDAILLLNYFESEGEVKNSISVMKTRRSDNDSTICEYEIGADGFKVTEALRAYEGVLSGTATKTGKTTEESLRDEFNYYLGPMGATALSSVREEGLDADTLETFIDGLMDDGVLGEEEGVEFRERALAIVAGETPPPRQETDVNEHKSGIRRFF